MQKLGRGLVFVLLVLHCWCGLASSNWITFSLMVGVYVFVRIMWGRICEMIVGSVEIVSVAVSVNF